MKISGFGRFAQAAIIGVAAAMVAVGTATAADLATKAPLYKAPPRAFSWTGCYIGGTVGWGTANKWNSTDVNGYGAPGSQSQWEFSEDTSVLGGGTLGCNWQPTNWLVLGVEGEGGYLQLSGNGPQPLMTGGFNAPTVNDGVKMGSAYGLIAGRVGVAFDRLLIYGKVGVAFYNASATVTDSANPALNATGSKSETPLALGFGGEYAIWDHWTGKAEYMYFDKGSSFNATSGGFTFAQEPSSVHTFKMGINYKF